MMTKDLKVNESCKENMIINASSIECYQGEEEGKKGNEEYKGKSKA